MSPKIERVTEDSCVLGEGPHWDEKTQNLYFVDILGKALLRYEPTSKELWKVSVAPRQPSFIIPVEDKTDHFVVSFNNELAIVKWNGKDDTFSVTQTLSKVSESTTLNDAKCDSSGRLWTGTYGTPGKEVHVIPPVGTLYSYDHRLTAHVDKIQASNGLAFNDQNKKMFYIDSFKGTIDQFDFEIESGTITNREILFTLSKHDIDGIPDGMTIDTDGNLWVAIFMGSRIIKISGNEPELLLESIQMPVRQVSSVTFGGPNLDELYVTTGAFEYDGRKPSPSDNGATYRITGIGAKGVAGSSFKLP